MAEILSEDDLIELTGYTRKREQCAALDGYGVRYFKRRDGRPAVPKVAVAAALNLAAEPIGSNPLDMNDGFNL